METQAAHQELASNGRSPRSTPETRLGIQLNQSGRMPPRMRSLSASGSSRIPMVRDLSAACGRGSHRCHRSLTQRLKIAEASNSFSPVTLLKRLLERIHISRGMLKMRIKRDGVGQVHNTGWVRGQPESSLIMLPTGTGNAIARMGPWDRTR